MSVRLIPPDGDMLARGTPFLRLLVDAAGYLGGQIEMEKEYGFLGRYTAPDGCSRPVFGKSLGLNRDSAAALAADKDYTARMLSADGLPAPTGVLVFSDEYRTRMALKNQDVARRLPGTAAAIEFAQTNGYPVVVKPNAGSEGRDVNTVTSDAALSERLEHLFNTDDRIRVEAFCPGRDYRLLVFDGRVRLAYERCPLSICGDGEHSVSALIDAALASLSARHRGNKLAKDDPRIAGKLAAQGLNLNSVLPAGARVAILDNANLSTGGTLHDLTGHLPAATEDFAIRAVKTLGLRVAGVDILAPDLQSDTARAVILEVNSAPGLDYYASESSDHYNRALQIVIEMLAAGDRGAE